MAGIRQWLIVPALQKDHFVTRIALPITYTKENLVMVGTSGGADTIVGIKDLTLNSFNIATSYNENATFVISIGY